LHSRRVVTMEIDPEHINTADFLIRNIGKFDTMVRVHIKVEDEVPVWAALRERGAKMENSKFVTLHDDLVKEGDFYALDVLFDITEKMPWVIPEPRPKEADSLIKAVNASIAIGGEREVEKVSKLVCDKKFPKEVKKDIMGIITQNRKFYGKFIDKNRTDGAIVGTFPTELMQFILQPGKKANNGKNQNNGGGSPKSIQFAMRH